MPTQAGGDAILASMRPEFDARYTVLGRALIPLERLLLALLLQVLRRHPEFE